MVKFLKHLEKMEFEKELLQTQIDDLESDKNRIENIQSVLDGGNRHNTTLHNHTHNTHTHIHIHIQATRDSWVWVQQANAATSFLESFNPPSNC